MSPRRVAHLVPPVDSPLSRALGCSQWHSGACAAAAKRQATPPGKRAAASSDGALQDASRRMPKSFAPRLMLMAIALACHVISLCFDLAVYRPIPAACVAMLLRRGICFRRTEIRHGPKPDDSSARRTRTEAESALPTAVHEPTASVQLRQRLYSLSSLQLRIRDSAHRSPRHATPRQNPLPRHARPRQQPPSLSGPRPCR